MSTTNDAIQSLSRISQASARMMAHMHWCDAAVDPDDVIAHIQANLDTVKRLVESERS